MIEKRADEHSLQMLEAYFVYLALLPMAQFSFVWKINPMRTFSHICKLSASQMKPGRQTETLHICVFLIILLLMFMKLQQVGASLTALTYARGVAKL